MLNIFDIYRAHNEVPFAASRANWPDQFFIVVTKIDPKGDYGDAYGFPVDGETPNDHLAYSGWKKNMQLPNVGSYQWRQKHIALEDLKILMEKFYQTIAKEYRFHREDLVDREDEWFDELLGKNE